MCAKRGRGALLLVAPPLNITHTAPFSMFAPSLTRTHLYTGPPSPPSPPLHLLVPPIHSPSTLPHGPHPSPQSPLPPPPTHTNTYTHTPVFWVLLHLLHLCHALQGLDTRLHQGRTVGIEPEPRRCGQAVAGRWAVASRLNQAVAG